MVTLCSIAFVIAGIMSNDEDKPLPFIPEIPLLTRYDFDVSMSIPEAGSITTSHTAGKYSPKTQITLSVTIKNGFVFAGYSFGVPLDEGGELVSLEPNYTFVLSEDTKLVANFSPTTVAPEGKWLILYDANGGKCKESEEDDVKAVLFSKEYYLCPNTIPDWDYFEREGYLLYGYNTKPDGTGTYYAPGWNVVMPEDDITTLYCMWAKISNPEDFEYSISSEKVTITKYKGNDEFVVIPETLGGYPVATIAANAFNKNETMQKVFINKQIRTIADGAFKACSALEELYFSDSVTSIKDAAFKDCDELHKLNILAVVTPKYSSTRQGTYAIKYERLITAPGKKLIISSGSNTAYGINSPLFEQNLRENGYEYSIVNYGTDWKTAAPFFNEVISCYINEGDIVLLAPEIKEWQFGYSEINLKLWRFFEMAYDAFACVDIRHYSDIFTSFTEFNKTRNKKVMDFHAYEIYTKDTVNYYGDFAMEKVGFEKDYAKTVNSLLSSGGVGTWSYSYSISYMNKYANIHLFEIYRQKSQNLR